MSALLLVGSCMPMTPTNDVEFNAPAIAGPKRPRSDESSELCPPFAPKRARCARDTPEAEAAARSAYRILRVPSRARVCGVSGR